MGIQLGAKQRGRERKGKSRNLEGKERQEVGISKGEGEKAGKGRRNICSLVNGDKRRKR